MKQAVFIGSSRRNIKAFPKEACDTAGYQIWLVQQGREPDDWKPMPSIAPGVKEIRIHQPHEYRVIYVTNFPEAIYVLHAFSKKTQQTPKTDLDVARRAYAEIQARSKTKK